MKDFDDDLRQERERSTPVRTGTRKNWPFIRRALENGEPLNRIFRILKRAGEPVGKGPSSFRAAVKFWNAHDTAQYDPRNEAQWAPPVAADFSDAQDAASNAPSNEAQTTPSAEQPVQDRSRFGDKRFGCDFDKEKTNG